MSVTLIIVSAGDSINPPMFVCVCVCAYLYVHYTYLCINTTPAAVQADSRIETVSKEKLGIVTTEGTWK